MRDLMEIHYYNRGEAAKHVRDKGLPCAKSWLAKLACIGGGPIFRRFGRNVVYTASDLDDWIEARLTGPKTSTSDQAHSEAGAIGPAERPPARRGWRDERAI